MYLVPHSPCVCSVATCMERYRERRRDWARSGSPDGLPASQEPGVSCARQPSRAGGRVRGPQSSAAIASALSVLRANHLAGWLNRGENAGNLLLGARGAVRGGESMRARPGALRDNSLQCAAALPSRLAVGASGAGPPDPLENVPGPAHSVDGRDRECIPGLPLGSNSPRCLSRDPVSRRIGAEGAPGARRPVIHIPAHTGACAARHSSSAGYISQTRPPHAGVTVSSAVSTHAGGHGGPGAARHHQDGAAGGPRARQAAREREEDW